MKLMELVAEKVAENSGMTLEEAKKFGLKIRSDSNDWAYSDDGFAGFIFWEQGPEEWTMRFWEFFSTSEECQDIAAEIHTICGWGLIGVVEI